METNPVDDPRARYVNEPGLYRLIARSAMEKAEFFRDWVYEVVLPSIRKTGSYSVQAAAPTAKQTATWLDKCLEGKELMRLKNASLQCHVVNVVSDISRATTGFQTRGIHLSLATWSTGCHVTVGFGSSWVRIPLLAKTFGGSGHGLWLPIRLSERLSSNRRAC